MCVLCYILSVIYIRLYIYSHTFHQHAENWQKISGCWSIGVLPYTLHLHPHTPLTPQPPTPPSHLTTAFPTLFLLLSTSIFVTYSRWPNWYVSLQTGRDTNSYWLWNQTFSHSEWADTAETDFSTLGKRLSIVRGRLWGGICCLSWQQCTWTMRKNCQF